MHMQVLQIHCFFIAFIKFNLIHTVHCRSISGGGGEPVSFFQCQDDLDFRDNRGCESILAAKAIVASSQMAQESWKGEATSHELPIQRNLLLFPFSRTTSASTQHQIVTMAASASIFHHFSKAKTPPPVKWMVFCLCNPFLYYSNDVSLLFINY